MTKWLGQLRKDRINAWASDLLDCVGFSASTGLWSKREQECRAMFSLGNQEELGAGGEMCSLGSREELGAGGEMCSLGSQDERGAGGASGKMQQ